MANSIQPYDAEQFASALSRAQHQSGQDKGDEEEELEEGNNQKKPASSKIQSLKSFAKKLTSGLALQWSWYAFPFSFGLSFIFVDLLAFGHLVASETFCEIGEEWGPFNPFGHKIVEKIVFWFINAIIALVFIVILVLFIDNSTAEQMKADSQKNSTNTENNYYQ
jgi:uncharacterized membrane protein